VSQYTLIENARRFADEQSIDAHADEVAQLWAGFNEVAQHNPDAWNPAPMSADEIRTPGPRNRPLAFPYNKWHNSQWNVDQAAAFLLCSAEAARAHGVPEDRWIFPHTIVESNHMVPVTQRTVVHRAPGFAIAGRRAFELAGVGVDDVAHIDLYSCFPIAVRTQALEMGLGADRALTITGGMTFAGGPLNNYVLQSTAAMVARLRDDAGSLGLVTAISGMITKQGVSVWSSRPPEHGFRSDDVSDAVAEVVERREVSTEPAGPAQVVTYTVIYDGEGPSRGVVVAERDDGTRAIATRTDAALATAMIESEWCGRTIALDGAGSFDVP
jgi:acetyl-CoA C-acetyltransferase